MSGSSWSSRRRARGRKPEPIYVVLEKPRPSLWQRIGRRGRELVLLAIAVVGLSLLSVLLPR